MLHFHIDPIRCVQCGECAADCPMGIIDLREGLPQIPDTREKYCIRCQHCLAVCPTAALSILDVDPDSCQEAMTVSADLVENVLVCRRSVRRYRPEPVDPAVIDRLMRITAQAPTGKNQRRVRFTLIDDAAVMDRLRTMTLEGIRGAVIDGTLPEGLGYYAKFLDAWDKGRDVIFRGAPHMLIASAPQEAASPDADPFIALSYFEVMAHSLGLGTVWCGFAMWAVQHVVPELRIMLGIPADHASMYAMMFGHPDVRYQRGVQRPVQDVHRITLTDLEGA